MDEPTSTAEPTRLDPSAAKLADLTALTHLAFVTVVVWLEVLIVLGAVLGWEWIREPIMRCAHLGLVAFVGVNDLFGNVCFLTIWENRLRERAGQKRSEKSFLGKVVHSLLMCELDERTLRRIRLSFFAVVVVTFFVVWPRFS